MSYGMKSIVCEDVESKLCYRLEVRRVRKTQTQVDKTIRRMRIGIPMLVIRIVKTRLAGWT